VTTEIIWHDLECGGYLEDLALWRALARELGDPILDVGAGTGRVALELARDGHRVTALDRDPTLLGELARRAGGLGLETILADARSFDLDTRFALCVVPMQTIQLLGGPDGRAAFLGRVRAHLRPGGVMAAALAAALEPYEAIAGEPAPLPDMCERDGLVYSSFPTAIRDDGDGFVIERRREIVHADGRHDVEANAVRLDRLAPHELEREATAAGLTPTKRARIPATDDYVGSEVVIVRA
jgi:SAM-dependent methyltransferase